MVTGGILAALLLGIVIPAKPILHAGPAVHATGAAADSSPVVSMRDMAQTNTLSPLAGTGPRPASGVRHAVLEGQAPGADGAVDEGVGPRPAAFENWNWAGPVQPVERDRMPRKLSDEERSRLRDDIRDASRSMYQSVHSAR